MGGYFVKFNCIVVFLLDFVFIFGLCSFPSPRIVDSATPLSVSGGVSWSTCVPYFLVIHSFKLRSRTHNNLMIVVLIVHY